MESKNDVRSTGEEDGRIRLNLGSGSRPFPGWTNLDRKNGHEAYPLYDYDNESVDVIRASHLLEHFSRKESQDVVRHWVEKLKPGGTLMIAVPDVHKIKLNDPFGEILLMGGQTDEDDFHKSVWNEYKLREVMGRAGIDAIVEWDSTFDDCSCFDVSLNLMGTRRAELPEWEPRKIPLFDDVDPKYRQPLVMYHGRCLTHDDPLPQEVADKIEQAQKTPEPEEEKEPIHVDLDKFKVKGIMSVPRYGSMASRGIIQNALKPFQIELETSQGVFWHQLMEGHLDRCLEDGVDIAVCVDFDSCFTHTMVAQMLARILTSPEIDCLTSIQAQRVSRRPLLGTIDTGDKEIELKEEPVKVASAHFGLTMFKMEAFKGLPKPWFMPEPDPLGGWGPGRKDADIAFWRNWRDHGNTLYVEPSVRIGHVEEMVQWFNDQMNWTVGTIGQWRKVHLPEKYRQRTS